MEERCLPPAVLEKASLRGNEYAWRPEEVPDVLRAATEVGLATIGGQFQYRLPNGTCEMYWLNADSNPRRIDEPWSDYVERSAREVLGAVRKLIEQTDFLEEASKIEYLKEPQFQRVDLKEFLCFVVYLKEESRE